MNRAFTEMKQAVDAFCVTDFDSLSGADAARLLDLVTPVQRQLASAGSVLGAHAVAANQHNADGAASGADWLANKTGVSKKTASESLSREKSLADNPDVADKVRSGQLSAEKADVIASAACGDAEVARRLLSDADGDSVESLRHKAAQAKATNNFGDRHSRLRSSQFVSIQTDKDNMVLGQFRLLAENAQWLAVWARVERKAQLANERSKSPLSRQVAKAEAFGRFIGGSSSESTGGSSVAFHVDIDSSGETDLAAQLAGVGPLPLAVLHELQGQVLFKLLLKSKNKLLWYSEAKSNSTDVDLPEYIKRAVRSHGYDICSIPGCTELVDEVDHNKARTNGGDHQLDNLQSLCKSHHDAKTKQDAPWTAGGIYGRARSEWQKMKQRREQPSDDDMGSGGEVGNPTSGDTRNETLFPDTG